MKNISHNNFPVLCGYFNYLLVRSCPGTSYLQRYTQDINLVTQGRYAVRLFSRFGSVVMTSDSGTNCPFAYLMTTTS